MRVHHHIHLADPLSKGYSGVYFAKAPMKNTSTASRNPAPTASERGHAPRSDNPKRPLVRPSFSGKMVVFPGVSRKPAGLHRRGNPTAPPPFDLGSSLTLPLMASTAGAAGTIAGPLQLHSTGRCRIIASQTEWHTIGRSSAHHTGWHGAENRQFQCIEFTLTLGAPDLACPRKAAQNVRAVVKRLIEVPNVDSACSRAAAGLVGRGLSDPVGEGGLEAEGNVASAALASHVATQGMESSTASGAHEGHAKEPAHSAHAVAARLPGHGGPRWRSPFESSTRLGAAATEVVIRGSLDDGGETYATHHQSKADGQESIHNSTGITMSSLGVACITLVVGTTHA